MRVRLTPDPDQIRWYAKAAIGSFETLSREDAIDMALADLRAILDYLDHFDKSVAIDDTAYIAGVPGGTWVRIVQHA